MGIAKYILPALTVASLASAQDGCSKATMTIATGGDAQAVANCQTFTGDIVIQTGAAVDNKLALDGVKKIDGKLTYQGDDVVEMFSANTLEEITGVLTLSNLTHLSQIDLSSLGTASDILFEGLGALQALGFGNPGLKSAGNVTIDNTVIENINGLSNASELAGVAITNNQNLNQIALSLSKIGAILIGPNAVDDPKGVSFSVDNLETADLIIVRNCSSVDMPVLTSVTGALGLIGNTFESFKAENLTSLGALVVDDNTKLQNMSFPALEAVNGSKSLLEVANNTKLAKIEGFGNLKTVTGGVNLFGTFDSASFPSLSIIRGALNVDTTSKTFNCDKLPAKGSGPVKGNVNCKAGDDHVKGGTATNGDTSASSSSPASAAAIPESFMPWVAGLIALFAL